MRYPYAACLLLENTQLVTGSGIFGMKLKNGTKCKDAVSTASSYQTLAEGEIRQRRGGISNVADKNGDLSSCYPMLCHAEEKRIQNYTINTKLYHFG